MVGRLSTRSRSRAASRLWRIHANSAKPGRGSPIADIPAAAVYPSISRPTPGQPARLAFQTITRDVDLQMMDLEARLVNDTIESKPFSNSTRIEGSARFSPDGSRIAFVSFRSGGPEIWVAGRDGSGLQQITSLGAPGLLVGGWSPDGARIAFEAAIAGNTDVYRCRGRWRAPASADRPNPPWTEFRRGRGTDGGSISHRRAQERLPDIWRVSSDGGQAIRLTHNGGFEPRESPDGRYLFYLDRHPAGLAIGGTCQADARTRSPADRRNWCSSAFGRFCGRSRRRGSCSSPASRTSMRLMCTGSAISGLPAWAGSDFGYRGSTQHMTVSRDGRWALATKMVRFDSDLMRLDNFR